MLVRRPALVICLTLAACGGGKGTDRLGDAGLDAAGSRDDARDDAALIDGAPAVSCVNVPPTCGRSGTSPCCSNSLVTGGTFDRAHDVGTDNRFPSTANPATVSDFRLDTYEVSVARFRQFVNAGMGTQQHAPAAGAGARTLNGAVAQGGWDAAWNSKLPETTAALETALICDNHDVS